MTNLRKEAQGKPCYLRIGQCASDETVVLCHLRIGGIAGVGQKPPDICAVPGCESCHSILDGRTRTILSKAELHAIALRGLLQWLSWLSNNGKIK